MPQFCMTFVALRRVASPASKFRIWYLSNLWEFSMEISASSRIIFTRGHQILSLPTSLSVYVWKCVCISDLLVGVSDLFKLGSPNSDQRCKTSIVLGAIDLHLPGQLELKVKFYQILKTSRLSAKWTRHPFKLGSPKFGLEVQNNNTTWLSSVLFFIYLFILFHFLGGGGRGGGGGGGGLDCFTVLTVAQSQPSACILIDLGSQG